MLMVRSMQRLAEMDLGVKTENVLTQRIFLPAASYNNERALRFHREVLERTSNLPGVTEVAMGSNLPLARLGMEVAFDPENAPVRAMSEMNSAGYTTATPGYFHLLGVPRTEGRDFEDTDTETAPGVAIVNASFVRRFFPNGGAVGQRLRVHKPVLGTNDFAPVEYIQIVGAVADVTLDKIGVPPPPMIYVPLAQNVWSTAHWLAVRTAGDPAGIASAVRETIQNLDPDQPQDPPTSLAGSVAAQFAEPKFQSRLMGGFAALAFVLALIGIYSVNAYAVTQRTREIGVRLALGEMPGSVMRDVLSRGMKVTLVGIALGLGAAAALNALLGSALVDTAPVEIVPMLGSAVVLTIAAAVACWLPAWRATRIHPAIALRSE
jgi:putative ABC transport system permease protein